MVERLFELLEYSRVLNQISLHFGRDLLVELELFDNQVEVIKESLLNVFSDVVVQSWLDMERLI